MRFLVAAATLFLAAPAAAHAAEAQIVSRAVPLGARGPAGGQAPIPFDLVGLHWQGTGRVLFRTRSRAGRWTSWHPADPEAEDLPDEGSTERAAQGSWRIGNPYWTGPSDRIEYRLRGPVRRLRAYFVSSPVGGVPPRTLSLAVAPAIVPRAGWGADESIRRAPPQYAAAVHFAVVHHTAGSNAYNAQQSAAIVRGIEIYHVRGNGWNDVGYNFLVDKYGQVFEGRFGGIERNVIGAHAEGFNTGSVGVAVLGTYGRTGISAKARTALAELLAWRLDLAHVDPVSLLTWPSGGNPRFPPGTPVLLRAVAGHRDTGFTDCPGSALYALLGPIARNAAEVGLPKLYEPAARGTLGGQVRFTARLSVPRSWTVTVTDEAKTQVAAGAGTGAAVDWIWDASGVAQGRYTWTIAAGPDVRAARGAIGWPAATLKITGVQAKPGTITPNGDSRADSTTISYTLSQPATVTGTLRDSGGAFLTTLFSGPRPAGRNAFSFAADGVPDGAFLVVLTARATNGKEVRATVPVIVDRTLAGFEAQPAVFSPNGDGRLDRVRFSFVLTTRADAALRVYRGRTWIATPFKGLLETGAQELIWDGTKGYGRLRDGAYKAVLSVDGPLGTRSQTAAFASDTTRPRLRLLSVRPLRFWVSEPATLTLVVNGEQLVQSVRAGTVRIRYPFAVRRLTARAEDAGANRSLTVVYP